MIVCFLNTSLIKNKDCFLNTSLCYQKIAVLRQNLCYQSFIGTKVCVIETQVLCSFKQWMFVFIGPMFVLYNLVLSKRIACFIGSNLL